MVKEGGKMGGAASDVKNCAPFGGMEVNVKNSMKTARGENRTPDQGLMSPLLYR
jgi:hypothetical protein